MTDEPMLVGVRSEKQQLNPLWVLSLAIFGLILVLLGIKIGGPVKHSYSFVTVDHPVHMWEEGSDKWSYFSLFPEQEKEIVAAAARKELTPLGFTEDSTQRPWFRFVKGNQEVVVCYHHEFGVNQTKTGSKLVKGKVHPGGIGPSGKWSVVLVKNGPGTETSVGLFNVKKLIHGW